MNKYDLMQMIEDYADLHYKYGQFCADHNEEKRKKVLTQIAELHKKIKDIVYE